MHWPMKCFQDHYFFQALCRFRNTVIAGLLNWKSKGWRPLKWVCWPLLFRIQMLISDDHGVLLWNCTCVVKREDAVMIAVGILEESSDEETGCVFCSSTAHGDNRQFSAIPWRSLQLRVQLIAHGDKRRTDVLCNSLPSSVIPELNRTWATRCNYGDNVRTAAIIMVIMWQL